MGSRKFICRGCGRPGSTPGSRGPKPHYHVDCAPTKQARHQARYRAVLEERDALRDEVEELRARGGMDASQEQRLALASDLLGAYARWWLSEDAWPSDEQLADALLEAVRADTAPHARRALLAVAGGCLLRALGLTERRSAVMAERRVAG